MTDAVPVVEKVPAGHVPLAKAAEKIRVQLSNIMEILFEGRLRRSCRVPTAKGFSATMVDPVEIKRLLLTPRPGMPASLAFMISGIKPKPAGGCLNPTMVASF
ncbi:hypothetical protein [Allgaiera indica]|uniref:hypothetical protein n=1 Tax=Allgaiera indica TaxID=765699 RepID=UPI00115F99B4|nr:hypothetical protein [Allgaiera indica]